MIVWERDMSRFMSWKTFEKRHGFSPKQSLGRFGGVSKTNDVTYPCLRQRLGMTISKAMQPKLLQSGAHGNNNSIIALNIYIYIYTPCPRKKRIARQTMHTRIANKRSDERFFVKKNERTDLLVWNNTYHPNI
jgi:hypothetical protein